jgi:hypothetical protein
LIDYFADGANKSIGCLILTIRRDLGWTSTLAVALGVVVAEVTDRTLDRQV